VVGRCLRERRPVAATDASELTRFGGDADAGEVQAELVAPLWVGEDLWGVVDVQEARSGSFDEDDARLVAAVADQIGSALRSAMLYERLEGAYLGTAEALCRGGRVQGLLHPRPLAHRRGPRPGGGARLAMGASELRTLRFAAIFHDIGKIAVPEAILNKRGPLAPAERREIERHTVVGERILSTVDFLKEVLPLIRHEHERWDGRGYPDGLAGEEIPLGSRVILACDAYSAMTSDRPYRPASAPARRAPSCSRVPGTQFDERVVSALLQELDSPPRSAARELRQVVLPPPFHARGGLAEGRLDLVAPSAPSRRKPGRTQASVPRSRSSSPKTVPPSSIESRAPGGRRGFRPPACAVPRPPSGGAPARRMRRGALAHPRHAHVAAKAGGREGRGQRCVVGAEDQMRVLVARA
jgi:hypothetical protein